MKRLRTNSDNNQFRTARPYYLSLPETSSVQILPSSHRDLRLMREEHL